MRFITPVIYAALFATAIYAAIAQTGPLPAVSETTASVNTTKLAYAVPTDGTRVASKPAVRVGKREACRQMVAGKHLKHRDARDQMQLCVAQARVDCLKQAIDQKMRGAQRRVYVKACVAT